MKIFVAGATGAIGRPLIAELLAKEHAVVALTRSPEKAQALLERGIEPAVADVFYTDAVKAVVSGARPEIVIEQLTALPRTYTRQSLSAAADFNTRIRLGRRSQCSGGRPGLRCAALPEAVDRILGGSWSWVGR